MLDVGECPVPPEYIRDFELLEAGFLLDPMDLPAVELDWLIELRHLHRKRGR